MRVGVSLYRDLGSFSIVSHGLDFVKSNFSKTKASQTNKNGDAF